MGYREIPHITLLLLPSSSFVSSYFVNFFLLYFDFFLCKNLQCAWYSILLLSARSTMMMMVRYIYTYILWIGEKYVCNVHIFHYMVKRSYVWTAITDTTEKILIKAFEYSDSYVFLLFSFIAHFSSLNFFKNALKLQYWRCTIYWIMY